MKFLMTIAAVLSLANAQTAAAQGSETMDHGAMDHSAMGHATTGTAEIAAAETSMPAACMAGAGGAAMPPPDGMAHEGELDAVQRANHAAMDAMHGPMMAAAMIKDADLAFNCGMIAHHRGAIAMAKVQLTLGNDEASRILAEAVIAAQEKEIAEMTAWVENYKP